MPGHGRRFYFFGKTRDTANAERIERKHPGTFIIPCKKNQWCVVKPK